MNAIEFEEYDLENGLYVILHRDQSAPLVAVSVMYHVGSKNERPDRSGFAHFFEHLLFEGSENIERGKFDQYVLNNGGTLNANTWYDRTFYYVLMPSNQLEMGLWLESERMLHAKVDQKGIETQRKVVKEERSQRYDNKPYGTWLEETMRRAFTVHPYKTSVIGNMAHLDAASEEDFQEFYNTYYIPNNAVLSIAGNLDIDATKELVDKYFGTIPSGKKIERVIVEEPPLNGEVRDVVYDNIQLPAVIQGYRIPEQGTDDFYALTLLSNLLSNGESSRLNKALVDEQQLAVQVFSIPLSLEDPGVSLLFALANFGITPEQLEAAIDQEIEQLKSNLISEREYSKLLNQMEKDSIQEIASVAGVAESLAQYHMYFGDASLINTELKRFQSVSREDLQRVAQTYFNKDNRVLLYYLPKENTINQPQNA